MEKKQQPMYSTLLSLFSTCYIEARNIANINDCVVFQFSLKEGKTNKNCKIHKWVSAKKSEECCGHFLSFLCSILLCAVTLTFGRLLPMETGYFQSANLLQSLPRAGSDGVSNILSSDGISYTLFLCFYSFPKKYFLSG